MAITKHIDILNTVYSVFPDAKIYGIYVTHHYLRTTDLCNEINFMINRLILKRYFLILVSNFRHKELLERYKLHELKETGQVEYQIYLKNNISLALIGDLPYYKAHIIANCLTMNKNDQISLLLCPPNQKKEQFTQRIYQDIRNKQLNIIGKIDNIPKNIEYRSTHLKLIRDSICLINQGWTLNFPLKYKVYSEKRDNDCAICIESILKGTCLELECQHVFHLDCISETIMVNEPSGQKCPVCRAEIFK